MVSPKTVSPKHVCVIGAGVSGLAAAKAFSTRGHKVTIVESSADMRTTSAGSVRLWSWLNKASSFCIGETQNSARQGLSDLLK